MRLVEQPPPLVPHPKYPVHSELPHLKYVAWISEHWAFVCVCVRLLVSSGNACFVVQGVCLEEA